MSFGSISRARHRPRRFAGRRSNFLRSQLVLMLAGSGCISSARAEDRNCPVARDQLVVVTPGQPAAFRLDVTNPDNAIASVFQYPLEGSLSQPGPTPLDFVFVPTRYFSGTTTFTYRLTPKPGCNVGTQLATVTLVGGTAGGTSDGLAISDPATGLCGAGLLPMALAGVAAVACGGRVRRSRL